MKNLILIFFLIVLSGLASGQTPNYNEKLAKYITEFKYNAANKDVRDNLSKEVYNLYEQIEVHLGIISQYSTEYNELRAIENKVYAFYKYISLFDYGFVDIAAFKFINNLLKVYPKPLNYLDCSLASFFEIEIGKLKAIVVYNKLQPTRDYSKNYYSTIRVEYDYVYNNRLSNGSFVNLGGNAVRALMTNDIGNKIYPISAVRCKEIK